MDNTTPLVLMPANTNGVDPQVLQLVVQIGGGEGPDPRLADDHVAGLRGHPLVDGRGRRVGVERATRVPHQRPHPARLGEVEVLVLEGHPDVADLPAPVPDQIDGGPRPLQELVGLRAPGPRSPA